MIIELRGIIIEKVFHEIDELTNFRDSSTPEKLRSEY